MTYGNPDRVSLPAPRTLYLLGQSKDDPAERSTNWVVVTAEADIYQNQQQQEEEHKSWT